MKIRMILTAATWAAVLVLLAGNARAQSPTSPGGQLLVVGVVLLEDGRGLAWVQDPTFTNNKIVTVRLGDSVGPYRVTKILTNKVELTGPGGTLSIPLAGAPGAVSVASSGASSSPGASSAEAAKQAIAALPPHPAVHNPNAIVIPPGDPRREFPSLEVVAGESLAHGFAPSASPPAVRAPSSVRDVPVPASMQAPPEVLPPHPALKNPNAIVILPGDPRREFPVSKMFVTGG